MATWETVPDGTYFETPDGLVPVTPKDGYFVALKSDTRAGRKAPFVGVWTAGDGVVHLDRSKWIAGRQSAIEIAIKHEQIAIWDCENNAEIYTQ